MLGEPSHVGALDGETGLLMKVLPDNHDETPCANFSLLFRLRLNIMPFLLSLISHLYLITVIMKLLSSSEFWFSAQQPSCYPTLPLLLFPFSVTIQI